MSYQAKHPRRIVGTALFFMCVFALLVLLNTVGGAATSSVDRVSVASDGSQTNSSSSSDHSSISDDGRFVAFDSTASNLVPDDTNDTSDIFVRDTQTGSTERVSVDSAGKQSDGFSEFPQISGNGRFVVFWSAASNLVANDDDTCGRRYAPSCPDIFVHDRQTGETDMISGPSQGNDADNLLLQASISDDGQFVAFTSPGVSVPPGGVSPCTIDAPPCDELYLWDRQTDTTTLESANASGEPSNYTVGSPMISGDGQELAFVTGATNLVPGKPTCDCRQVFVRDLVSGALSVASADDAGDAADADVWVPFISQTGRYVSFYTSADRTTLVVTVYFYATYKPR